MADSVRLRIAKAGAAALDITDPDKPAGLAVHRSRHRPIEKDQLPAIVVYSIVEDVEPENLQDDKKRKYLLRLELRAKGTPPDDVLDPLYVWAVKRIMADPKFGGLAKRTKEVRVAWAPEAMDEVLAAAAVDFEIEYVTAGADPEELK